MTIVPACTLVITSVLCALKITKPLFLGCDTYCDDYKARHGNSHAEAGVRLKTWSD